MAHPVTLPLLGEIGMENKRAMVLHRLFWGDDP